MKDQPAAEQQPESPGSGEPIDPVLRAKYLDYCSARLSEVFLSLSPERIYLMVEEAADESDLNPADLGFEAMVELVTEKLHQSVPLPDLPTWAADYRAHPEDYDPYLLGFWEDAVGGEDPADGGDEP